FCQAAGECFLETAESRHGRTGRFHLDDVVESAPAAGGKQYPVTAMPMTQLDWIEHFGADAWKMLSTAKGKYDPKNVLTPGPGIFSSANE
ncbi:MAG TPA: hypothetical protein VFC14_24060, partial [Burkholderiales bacterium]|nr:hypothetical protein [Burkholderiales bacterium]